MDEEVDLANVSTTSFGTPVASLKKRAALLETRAPPDELPEEDVADEDEVDEALGDIDETAEPTVNFGRTQMEPSIDESVEGLTIDGLDDSKFVTSLPAQETQSGTTATPHGRQKVKVTTELERIVVSICGNLE